MDKSQILNTFLTVLLPMFYTAFGPTVTIMVTATINKLVGAYVPRSLQIPLASLFSAVAAGLTGGDPAVAVATGGAMQTALSMNSKTFLASAPPTVPPVTTIPPPPAA